MTAYRHTALRIALAILLTSGIAAARQADDPSAGVPSSIRHWEPVAMMSAAAGSTTGGEAELVELTFSTLGREFAVKLEPSDIFAPGARIIWGDETGSFEEPLAVAGQEFFKGRLDDDPDSWVRLHIAADGSLAGMIATHDEVYFLESSRRYFGAEAEGETFAYRLSDADPEWLPGSCAAQHPRPSFTRKSPSGKKAWPSALHQMVARAGLQQQAAAAAGLKRAQIGIVLDHQYTEEHGANSQNDITEVMNAVDGIYQAELGVTMQILTIKAYTAGDDPLTATTDYNALLSQISDLHNNNDDLPSQMFYNADLVHLVTNRDLNGSVIGVAWLDGLCSGYYGSGLSQDYTSALYNMTLLLAHEMGHNFGAPHDAQSGSACSAAPNTFIMNPVLSSSLQQKFSDCSKTQIAPSLNGATCFDDFTPGPSPTPTFAPPTNTPTRTPTRTNTPTPVPLVLNPFASAIVIGAPLALSGTGFTAGSVMQVFVASATGVLAYGPYTPNSRTATTLTFTQLDKTIPLGNGFGTVVVINTDQNYRSSNPQSALLLANASLNMPSITRINNVALRAFDPTVPVANVETAVTSGSIVTITGTGFSAPLVNLYTATTPVGPLAPLPGGNSTSFQVQLPANLPTGPGAFQVINSPYVGNVVSNSVSVAIGAPLTLTGITQSGSVVHVHGTGLSVVSIVNLFNKQANGSVVNLGGLDGNGLPALPITIISDQELTFAVPAGAFTGPAFVQILNPPYIPFSSTGGDPDGGFTLVAGS